MPSLATAWLAVAPGVSVASACEAMSAATKRDGLAKQARLKAFGSCNGIVRRGAPAISLGGR